MDVDAIIQDIIVYVQDNIIVAAILGLFFLFLLFRHPKILLTLLGIAAMAYGVAWLFEKLAQTGLG